MKLDEWTNAERDARTLYDILKSRSEDHRASRDDVTIAEIALRNWRFVSEQYPLESSDD